MTDLFRRPILGLIAVGGLAMPAIARAQAGPTPAAHTKSGGFSDFLSPTATMMPCHDPRETIHDVDVRPITEPNALAL